VLHTHTLQIYYIVAQSFAGADEGSAMERDQSQESNPEAVGEPAGGSRPGNDFRAVSMDLNDERHHDSTDMVTDAINQGSLESRNGEESAHMAPSQQTDVESQGVRLGANAQSSLCCF
jgi:hypothetical protein